MIDKLQDPLAFTGRLLLAALFLPAGLGKLTGFAGTVGYISSVGLPMPQVAAAAALVVEIAGGLALVVGYRTRVAALVLAAFTLVASVFFHNYWAAPADAQMVQQLLFVKNVAVVGGLLTLAAWGAGAWSVDARRVPGVAYRQQLA
ncbi:MAG TPA: DoxX family protein [Casimicrobiaceae bacterium]